MRGSRNKESISGILQEYGRFLADRSVPLRTRIQMGTEVWRAQSLARAILDPLKDSLREEALRILDGPGTATIEGEGFTQATVTVLPPMMKLKDEPFNIDEARAALGPDFDRVFRVILRPDANNFLHTLPPAAQRFLSKVVDQAKETPRVSLQTPGSGIENRK